MDQPNEKKISEYVKIFKEKNGNEYPSEFELSHILNMTVEETRQVIHQMCMKFIDKNIS